MKWNEMDAGAQQEAARRMVDREVCLCLSSLVSPLAKSAYEIGEAVRPAQRGREGADLAELSGLCEQARELCAPIPDFEEAAIQEGWKHGGDNGGFWFDGKKFATWKEAASDGDAITYASAEEICEAEGIDPYDCEVYEHWVVSERLADKLEQRGEKVDRDFAGLNVWARTTTGQAISSDGVIEAICAEIHS